MSIDNFSTAELKHLLKDCRRRNERIRSETIEECARVADGWVNYRNPLATVIAAAIRALKDKT